MTPFNQTVTLKGDDYHAYNQYRRDMAAKHPGVQPLNSKEFYLNINGALSIKDELYGKPA